MTLQLASLASFLLVATGLTVLGLALRKAAQVMRHAHGLITAVAGCSADLDRALAALATERAACERLEESLDTQLRHGRKTYTALNRTIDLCQRFKTELDAKAASGPASLARPIAAGAQDAKKTATPTAKTVGDRKLPAFVHRTVKGVHAAQKHG